MALNVGNFVGEQETRTAACGPARKQLAPVSEYPLTSKKLQDTLLNLRTTINTQASTRLNSMTMAALVEHNETTELAEPEDEESGKAYSALHAWLIMLKVWRLMSRYAAPILLEKGLGESDFRVLEVMLHKGPMPVNAIGPKVDLNPGSVSVAVDRLYKKGFVSRVECSSDRRIRTVSLTEKGREMFAPLFRRHAALIKRAFQDVSSEELQQLEAVLKKIGERAESL